MSSIQDSPRPSPGRPQVTTHAQLEHVAFELFSRNGFDRTSVDEIGVAAGIGRRTFFRYYASKTDIVWGDFAAGLDRMRAILERSESAAPLLEALRVAVLDFNTVPPAQVEWHRRRMRLILGEPTLLANSTLRFAAWRAVIGSYVAERLGLPDGDLLPVMVGHTALAASLTAYEVWLASPHDDLAHLLDQAWDVLESGLSLPRPVSRTTGRLTWCVRRTCTSPPGHRRATRP